MLHARTVQSGAMGYLSPSLNEKLASYHAADLRATAEVRRQRREAREVGAVDSARGAAPAGFDLGRHHVRRFEPRWMWRWRERLGWALVGAGMSLLAGEGAQARPGAVIPMKEAGRTRRPIATPVGCGYGADA
jgi:hypothetical protein